MRRVALIGFLALISSACTLDVDIGIQLTPSGSGTVSVNVVTDEEFQSLYSLTGRDFEDLIASRGAELGLSFVVVPGGPPRYFAEAERVNSETLEGILEGLAPGLGTIDLSATEESIELDGRLNSLTDIDDAIRYFEGTDPAQFADAVSVTVTLSTPGELESTTGTRTGAGDLTWEIPLTASETRVFARSALEPDGQAFPWALAVGAGTLAVAVGFLIAIRSGLTGRQESTLGPRPIPTPSSTPPEQQAVGPDATPPEDQSVAPPSEAAGA